MTKFTTDLTPGTPGQKKVYCYKIDHPIKGL